MGVLTLDSYVRKTYPQSVRYYKPGQKITGKFKCLGLDANPFVYSSVYRAFECGPCETMIPVNAHLTYDEKVRLVMEYTWEQIVETIEMVECEEIYIAFDGVAPVAKQVQQRQRRYSRSCPSEGEFDLCSISTGTKFLHDLCIFIKYKIHLWQLQQTVIFSSQNVPGEGEHKIMDHFRTYPAGTKVCMFGPDGDLIMLGLACNLDFTLFKMNHRTQYTDPQYYTISMKSLSFRISGHPFSIHRVRSFVFLGFLLGNDFVPRLEIFHLFYSGITDLYNYYKPLRKNIIHRGKLDLGVFRNLLDKMALDEPGMMSKRTEHEYPLLDKHKSENGLDFMGFRTEYYKEWMGITTNEQIHNMCVAYLDTLWWNWIYYTEGCPTFDHCYGYHYPPFICDLAESLKKWTPPVFVKSVPRTPFQQLCAIMPKNRRHLLPEKYHHVFDGPDFPDPLTVRINKEGRHPEYEAVFEVPIVKDIDSGIVHKHRHNRNLLGEDRVFRRSNDEWSYKTKYGDVECFVEG